MFVFKKMEMELQGYLKFDSRAHTLENIFKALLDPGIKTIWLLGKSGVGMTTLVKQVAVCAADLALFDEIVSATVVAHKPDEALEGVRRQLAKALGLRLYFGDIGERIFNRLRNGKFLVIVEDVWKLEELVILLMRTIGGSGCKILFTSRSWDCIHLESWFGRCAKETIGVLEENEARRLFYKTVGNVAEHDQHLADMCNQVIGRCERLPVLIVTIATALSKRGEDPDWDFLHQLEMMKDKEPQEFANSAVELICYNYLQDPHKLLFLLCSILGNIKGDPIDISELQREWWRLKDIEKDQIPFWDVIWLELKGMGGAEPSLDSLVSDLKASGLLMQGETSSFVRMHELFRSAASKISQKIQHPDKIQNSISRWFGRACRESKMQYTPFSKEFKALNRMKGLVSLLSLYPMVTETEKMYKQVLETWASLFAQFNSIRKGFLSVSSRARFMIQEMERSKGDRNRVEAITRKEGFLSLDSNGSAHVQRLKSVMGEISSLFTTIQPILEENLAYLPPLLHVPSSSRTQSHDKEVDVAVPEGVVQFTIDSALSHMKTSIETETVCWMGVSGEGRHQVIEAFKKGGEGTVHIRLSLSVSRDWTNKIRETEIQVNKDGDEVDFVYLIDFHESVDVSEWIQHCTLWDLGRALKIVFITKSPVSYLPVDVQIKMEDYLLPWKLFSTNAGYVVHSSVPIKEVAAELVNRCGGNLTAIIILARALRDVLDVHVWKEALRELNRMGIFDAAVNLASKRRGWNVITKHCIVESLSDCKWVDRKSLITQWMSKGLTHSEGQGQEILNDLVDAFFFDSSGKPDVTRVMPQLHDII